MTTRNKVDTWVSHAKGAEYGFFGAVVDALESFNNGDTNRLAKMLCISHGRKAKRIKVVEKDRMQYATHLKRILDHSLEGVTYKFNGDKDFGVVFERSENAGVNTDRIETLKVLGKRTIRDKGYREAFPVIRKESEKTDAEKIQYRVKLDVKFCKELGLSKDAYIAAIKASDAWT